MSPSWSLLLLKWTEEFHWSKSAFTHRNALEFAHTLPRRGVSALTAHGTVNAHKKWYCQHRLISSTARNSGGFLLDHPQFVLCKLRCALLHESHLQVSCVQMFWSNPSSSMPSLVHHVRLRMQIFIIAKKKEKLPWLLSKEILPKIYPCSKL